MGLTYESYLKLDRLLELQEPQSEPPEHDELLFVVIHQVYELWFKLLLHEFEKIRDDLSAGRLFPAISTLKRTRTIMKTLVQQLDVLETMTPNSFEAFRDRLDTASGFQSVQFRELEFLLGYKREETLAHYGPEFARFDALKRRLREPSVTDAFHDLLGRLGGTIPPEVRNRQPRLAAPPNEALQGEILRLMRQRPEFEILTELMLDFDEGQQEWRYRHVKVVERTIGNKQGTGGSLGVEFLKRSLFNPLFPDLWAIRHRF